MFAKRGIALANAVLAGLSAGLWTFKASADVFNMPSGDASVSLVPVGDVGNEADPLTGYGSVDYQYSIGKYSVTSAQYAQFLNSVAASDPMGLYSPAMSPLAGFGSCGIIQSGSAGSYTYSVQPGDENFPVNEVSWGDAARFCNWLANGQPDTGMENASTTEDGSYALNGALTDQQLASASRSPSATYVIPNLNEWYKAAYYKGGSTNAGYWLYPTQSNTPPSNVLSMTGTNNANYLVPGVGFTDPTTGLTPVGAFADSPGPYGTYDMGGDVAQWTETIVKVQQRVFLGAAYSDTMGLESSYSTGAGGSDIASDIGFRIAEVPEPVSVGVLGLGAIALLRRRN